MLKATYIGDVIYFDTFEECKKYYGYENCEDIDDLEKELEKEYCGMAYPKIEEI